MANPLRVAVVGSDRHPNLDQIRGFIATLPDDTEVVSGGLTDANIVAVEAAAARGLSVRVFQPRFVTEGRPFNKFHCFDRNSEIVRYSKIVVVFPVVGRRDTFDIVPKAIRAHRRFQAFEPDDEATWDTLQAHFAKAVRS